MQKGVFPRSLAYWFALETTQAGVSEMPWMGDQTMFVAEIEPNYITYEVEDLSLLDQHVERVHDLFHGCGVVPPVHRENVDIRRAKLFERGFHGNVKRLGAIPRIIHHVALMATFVIGRILNCLLR
jgi:hypothetical protein